MKLAEYQALAPKPKRRRMSPEAALHKQVARYLRSTLLPDAWWTTFPLGGGGHVRGAQLKAAGAKKGTPDVLVVFAGRAHWIELKSDKGRLSDAQKVTLADLEAAGCPCTVAKTLDDVIFALRRWQVPLRARAA